MNRTTRRRIINAALALGIVAAAAAASPLPAGPPPEEGPAQEAARLVLARVDGETITLADLQEAFGARHMGHGSLLAGEVILRDVLEKAIAERLLVQEGRRMGLHEDPEVLQAAETYRDIQLLRRLEEREFHEAAAPTEEEIRAFYQRLPVQRRVFVIETASEERAREARARLDGGESFDEVARSLSVHRTRTRGGDLGWVTWGRLPPAVEEAAFGTPLGETAGPVAAEGSFFVIQAAEERKGEPPELARVEGQIREILRQRDKTRLFRGMIAEIRESHPPEENREALEALLQAERGGDTAPPSDDTVLMKTATGLELTAGRVRQRAESARVSLAEAWKKAAVDALLIDEARRRIQPGESLRRKVQAFIDARVRREVEMLALAEMPEFTEAQVREHFEAQTASFREGGSYHLRHILLGTEEEAREVRRALLDGADFAALARERSLDAESAPAGGDLGWMDAPSIPAAEGARGVLGLEAGEISEVISTDRGFAVVQVMEIRQAEKPRFEKVKMDVARSLVSAKKREIMEGFIERLEGHAEIVVDEKAVERGVDLLDEIAEERLTPQAEAGKPARHP